MIFFILLCLVFNSNVVNLTQANFDESKTMFVKFFAPWCGHCKTLAPIFEELAAELGNTLIIGDVDATVETSLGQKYQIQGYPTMKLFHKGNVIDYQGGRTKDDMLNWVLQQTGLSMKGAVSQLLNQSQYNEKCDFQGICIIILLPDMYDSDVEERNRYLQLLQDNAKNNKVVKYFWSEGQAQKELETKLQIGQNGYPVVVGISHKKGYYKVMKGSLSQKNFSNFVENDILNSKGFNKFEYFKIVDVKEWDENQKADL